MQKQLTKEIEEILKLGFICPSTSTWSSALWLVEKEDGSNRDRFDGKKLQYEITVPDQYPMHLIDSILKSSLMLNFYLL